MPDIFYNETKQDEILLSVNENQTISHPTILGQKAHETQTDYSNPRQTLVRIVEGDNIQKAIDAVKESGGGAFLGVKKNRRRPGMKRQASQTATRRNQGILERIQRLKADHPFWGYRRV